MTSSLVLQEGEVQEKVGQVCRAVRQALELQDNTEYKQGKTFFLPDNSPHRLNTRYRVRSPMFIWASVYSIG